MDDEYEGRQNIAQTLAEKMAPPGVLVSANDSKELIALPPGWTLEKIDLEADRANPRRTKLAVTVLDVPSFLAYYARHAEASTVIWANFQPVQGSLSFKAVFDDHTKMLAGWRGHTATLVPETSVEWRTWLQQNGKAMHQEDFANFLEQNQTDIATQPGMPSSLDMLKLATEFHARSEMSVKSTVRLQSGGVRLEYINDPDKGTTDYLNTFDKFAIGIPVFRGGAAFAMVARLKYRLEKGSVFFYYDLIRPDRFYEAAGNALIQQVRESVGATPVLMGSAG